MNYMVIAVLLAALIAAAGCTTPPPANATVTPAGTTVAPTVTVYTEDDSGRTVSLGLQQLMSVRLPENPSTGYSWNASVSSGLVIVGTAYTSDPVTPGIVGAGGTRNWTVRAVQAGTQEFTAVYVRPFEPNVPAGEFNLTVQVR